VLLPESFKARLGAEKGTLDAQFQTRGALQGRLLAAVGGLALLGHFILLNKNKENFLAKNSSTGLIDGAIDSLLSI